MSEASADEHRQSTLAVGAIDVLDRPARGRYTTTCPSCGRDVTDSKKPHRVERDQLADHVVVDAGLEDVPVYGWRCDDCARVLALDPYDTESDLGPSSGWLAVEAIFANGAREHVLVPNEVVL